MGSADSTSTSSPLTFLCLASYEKGHPALQELKRQGCRVYLVTSQSLKEKAEWPLESLDDVFYMQDVEHEWNLEHMLKGISYLARTVEIDRIIALDDFDVEKASLLREHLRLPGLGETATRYFRDKLAMRMRAAESGIRVPDFSGVFNYSRIAEFLDRVPDAWVLKPRLMAGALGIKKYHHAQEVWDRIHSLGDEQSFFLLERFVPGTIFHVDSLWFRGKMIYAVASEYGTPPLELTTDGGVFTTQILDSESEPAKTLLGINERVLQAFQLSDGASHTEFIRAHADGSFYFLETSARVGGAHISDLVEQASGLNLWAEWAKVEVAAARNGGYELPEVQKNYAGLLVSLAKQEWPDTSSLKEPELVWRLRKPHHIGLIVKSESRERVDQLMRSYVEIVRRDYQASAPAAEKLTG